ncbi:MAG: OmpA family protein [Candidatus Cyclobacteriaceae bacterium M3_2C_046]
MRSLIRTFMMILAGFISTLTTAQSVEHLDTAINSAYDELNPVVSPDGKTLYFTRKGDPENAAGKRDPGDIWMAPVLPDGKHGRAIKADKSWNNRNFNAIIGFTDNGNTVYLHNHYKKNDDKFKAQGVSRSTKRGNEWSFPEPVAVKYFQNKSEHQSISLAPNGKIMLLGLEAYANYGAEDIYVSFLQSDGTWTNPQNLGADINTRYQEITPYLLADNKTLVFASNGLNGAGSYDLFVAERLDDSWQSWSKPKGLNPKINTKGREAYYALTPDQDYVYFMSTQNSEGYGDINRLAIKEDDLPQQIVAQEDFSVDMELEVEEELDKAPDLPVETVSLPDTVVNITGKVLNQKTNEPLNAKITFSPEGTERASGLVVDAAIGNYEVTLPKPSRYTINISAKGFMNTEEKIVIGEGQNAVQRDFSLSPLEVGATFRLNNVLFQRGTTNLIDSSYAELDRVVEMMKDNPGIEIELAGHTDNQGSSRLNLKLSRDRVESVKDYIIQQGINPERIDGRGYGGSRPIASNKNEASRRLNRRVEFKVVRNNE